MTPHAPGAPAAPRFDRPEAVTLAGLLLDVLRQESAALAAGNFTGLPGFTTTKKRLVTAYAVKLDQLHETAPGAAVADGAPLGVLQALNAEIVATARRNAAFLKGAIEGTRRVIGVVMRAHVPPRPPGSATYRANGTWSGSGRRWGTA